MWGVAFVDTDKKYIDVVLPLSIDKHFYISITDYYTSAAIASTEAHTSYTFQIDNNSSDFKNRFRILTNNLHVQGIRWKLTGRIA